MKTNTKPMITLADLRSRTGQMKQSVIAATLHVQEPAISKLERKRISETSLQKAARYIAAIGGQMNVTITLPDGSIVELEDLCA